MTKRTRRHRIIILGAGYAGLPAAQRLARRVSRQDAQVTVVTATPEFVERPRLHQVAAGQQVPALPLGPLLDTAGAMLEVGRVTAIDLDRHVVWVDGDHGTSALGFDTLVYALGSVVDTTTVPGVGAYTHVLSGRPAARRLAAHARRLAEQHGTLVVCGGGPTGVEAATELAEAYPGLRIRLLARDDPGSRLSDRAARYLHRALNRLGVEVLAGTEVTEVRPGSLVLAGAGELSFGACLWAGGFTVPSLAREAGLAVNERGRVLVDETLRSVSHPQVYAIGDAAAASGRWGESMAFGCRTGGFMGPYAADAIASSLTGRNPAPFGFRYVHQCISLGRRDALIQFVHPRDERPLRGVLTGRLAVRYKETVLSGATWMFRHPGPYVPWARGVAASSSSVNDEAMSDAA